MGLTKLKDGCKNYNMCVGSKPQNDIVFNTREQARNEAVRVMFAVLGRGHGIELTTPKRIVTKEGLDGVERRVGDKWVRLRQDKRPTSWDLEVQVGKNSKETFHFVVDGEEK